MSEPVKDLVSIRGLVDSEFAESPLRKFTGVLDSYVPEPARGYDGTRVNLNFRDIEVLQSSEPYNFPTAVINIGLSNKKSSRWGFFAASLEKFLPEDEDIKEQVGKRLGMVVTDGKDERPEAKLMWNSKADVAKFPDKMVPTAVWEVFELEGASGVGEGTIPTTAAEQAMRLLDGKTMSEFNKAAYADPAIRKDALLQRSITDKSFIKAMLVGKQFSKDENEVYHRVVGK